MTNEVTDHAELVTTSSWHDGVNGFRNVSIDVDPGAPQSVRDALPASRSATEDGTQAAAQPTAPTLLMS